MLTRLRELFRTDDDVRERLASVEQRLDGMDPRVTGYYRFRWDAIDMLADYLVGSEVEGDYMEFGVFEGTTFSYACRRLAPLFPNMRFVAFDSFDGLPQPTGLDSQDGYTSGFTQGQFRCSESGFVERLAADGVDMERVVTVSGWFDESLQTGHPASAKFSKVAAAWIDCDLYESTVPVLSYLTTRLSPGTALLFDDWRCFRNLPQFGEQRACGEWLQANPGLTLNPLLSFGFHGQSFTVGDVPDAPTQA